jgi:FK506-binding protein 4/5
MASMKQDKESWELETPEKLVNAGQRKEEGNALFKAGNYARAAKRYEKVRFPQFTKYNLGDRCMYFGGHLFLGE